MLNRYDFLILGAGPAGLTAADVLRRERPEATVAIVSAETHCPYSRVMLPDVLTGFKQPADLCLKPAGYFVDHGIDFLAGSPAVRVDAAAHTVALASGSVIGYGKLLVATGSHARRLDVPGADLPGVFVLRDLDDVMAMRERIVSDSLVLVYGGGPVAMELAVACRERGANVTIAMRGNGFFRKSFSDRGNEMLLERMREHGVELMTGCTIESMEESGTNISVRFGDGTPRVFSAVVFGVGTSPNASMLDGTGISVDKGVVVNESLRTGDSDIYAAGDAAVFPDGFGRLRVAATWQNALLQGRVVARNMLGHDEKYSIATGHVVSFFGLSIAFVGDAENGQGTRVNFEGDDFSLSVFIDDGHVVGAACIGRFTARAAISKLINDRTEVSEDLLRAMLSA